MKQTDTITREIICPRCSGYGEIITHDPIKRVKGDKCPKCKGESIIEIKEIRETIIIEDK